MPQNPQDTPDPIDFEKAVEAGIEAGAEAERQRCIEIIEAHYSPDNPQLVAHILVRLRNLIANPDLYDDD